MELVITYDMTLLILYYVTLYGITAHSLLAILNSSYQEVWPHHHIGPHAQYIALNKMKE